MPRILRGEAWRLLTSQIVFQEHPQTILGGFLLYTFRQFERQVRQGLIVLLCSLGRRGWS